MTTKNKTLGKFAVTKVANGFTLSVLNPEYKPGQSNNGAYVQSTFIAEDIEGVAKNLVAYLVTDKLEGNSA